MNRVADLGSGTRTAWIVSLFLTSAVFGFSHYQQGLTGIIEEGSDGLILGLMYLACRRQPRRSRCRPRSLRYHRYRPAFLGQVSRPVEASRIANVFSPTFSCLVLRSTIMLGIFCHPSFLFRSTGEAAKNRFHSLTERQVV